jgi:predicted small secreted protein
MMKIIATTALFAGAMLMTACNTVKGAGRDVSSAGKAVSKEADKASDGKPN